MKKILIIFLMMLSGILSFGYSKVGGIYKFDEYEQRKLFGSDTACQLAGQIRVNHIILEYSLKDTSEYDIAKKEFYRQLGWVDDALREGADWDLYDNPYNNVQSFHSQNCPKIKHGNATKILGVQNMRILRDYGMIQ